MNTASVELSWRRKVLFGLVGVLLALGVLEAAARVVERWVGEPAGVIPPPVPLEYERAERIKGRLRRLRKQAGHSVITMVDDRERGWALPKGDGDPPIPGGYTRTNSLGMRGPELEPRAENEQRLFTMGDSSVFGIGVPEKHVFSSVAARELARRWGVPVSVAIGAAPGYDSYRSLQTLLKFGARVQPTWVVIANLWSDLYGSYSPQVRIKRRAMLRGPLAGLSLYRLIRRGLPGLRPIQVKWLASSGPGGALDDDRDTSQSLGTYRDNLSRMLVETRKLNARVLFLILPAPMDVSGDAYNWGPVKRFRAVLREMAAEHNAPLVDGPAVFKKAGAGLAWFLDNIHPSQEGHVLLGRALADAMSRAWNPTPDVDP